MIRRILTALTAPITDRLDHVLEQLGDLDAAVADIDGDAWTELVAVQVALGRHHAEGRPLPQSVALLVERDRTNTEVAQDAGTLVAKLAAERDTATEAAKAHRRELDILHPHIARLLKIDNSCDVGAAVDRAEQNRKTRFAHARELVDVRTALKPWTDGHQNHDNAGTVVSELVADWTGQEAMLESRLERNRELVADRDRLKAELDLLRDRVGAANGLSTMLERVNAQRDHLDAALTDARAALDATRANLDKIVAERTKLEMQLAAERDCGQEGVFCATAPGCARHWEIRNRQLVEERDALASAYSNVSRNLTAAMERVNSQRAEVLAEYLRTEDMDTKVAKLEADLSACAAECNRLSHRLQSERNCGQDDVCATAPGCARHWQERNRDLLAECNHIKAYLANQQPLTDRLCISMNTTSVANAVKFAEGYKNDASAADREIDRLNAKLAGVVADYKKLGDDMGRLSAERTKLEMQLAAERDCGQEGVCATAPGCARHWQERSRELAADRDRLAAKLAASDYTPEARALVRIMSAHGYRCEPGIGWGRLGKRAVPTQEAIEGIEAELRDASTEAERLAAKLEDREDDRLTLLAIREKLTDYVVANRLAGQKLAVVVDHVLADAKSAADSEYKGGLRSDEFNRMNAALFGADVKGGPGGWRWHSDPAGTTFGTLAAFCRLMLTRLDIGDAPEEARAPDLATANASAIAAVDRGLELRAAGWRHTEGYGWLSPIDAVYYDTDNAHARMVADKAGATAPTVAAIATPKSAEEAVREAVAEAHAACVAFATDLATPSRCKVCSWPIKATIDEGCTAESCSYRPEPGSDEHARLLADRAKAQPNPFTAERFMQLALLNADWRRYGVNWQHPRGYEALYNTEAAFECMLADRAVPSPRDTLADPRPGDLFRCKDGEIVIVTQRHKLGVHWTDVPHTFDLNLVDEGFAKWASRAEFVPITGEDAVRVRAERGL